MIRGSTNIYGSQPNLPLPLSTFLVTEHHQNYVLWHSSRLDNGCMTVELILKRQTDKSSSNDFVLYERIDLDTTRRPFLTRVLMANRPQLNYSPPAAHYRSSVC